ncbi:MAG TPA: ComEA family DNA-binding protein [bacterium]|nr:ComEA family DNA-binding protein [bacterium]
MNKKERLASAVLVLTLAVGILVDVFGRVENARSIDGATQEVHEAARGDSAGDSTSGGAIAETRSARPDSSAPRTDGEYRRIDLNSATLEELMLLPGLGPKKAGAVLAWRKEHGRFESVDELAKVKGIGKVTVERLRPYVCVGQ